MKLFRKVAAFLIAAVMLISAAPLAQAAEEEMGVPVPNGLMQTVSLPVFVDKLTGKEPADSDVFIFDVEPVSEEAKWYAEEGYLTYSDTITVGTEVDPADEISERLMDIMLSQLEEGLTEAQMEELQAYCREMAKNELSQYSSVTDAMEGIWAAGLIYINGRQDINDYGVEFPLVDDGDYTFRITERFPDSSDYITSKAVWELNINITKDDKWDISWEPQITLTRLIDDNGEEDGTVYDLSYDSVTGMAAVTVDFTNVFAGNALLRPADMTVYMNGEKGCGGVVADALTGETQSADSLPEPGFYMELPEKVTDILEEVWKDAASFAEVTDQDGNTQYVLDLTDYVTLKDSAGQAWTLEMYGDSYSMAYGRFVYRIVPAGETGSFPVQFTDRDGDICTRDEFSIRDALYEEYTMAAYPGTDDGEGINAEIRIAEDKILNVPVELQAGTLKVRYVTKEQSEAVFDIVDSPELVPAENRPLEEAVGIVSPDTTFYINESRIPVGENARPSLLFDDLVSAEDGGGDYGKLVKEAALDVLDTTFANPQYEAKYIDLVDAYNGNAWLKADDAVTVYWPYPEGTDSETEFYLVHLEGLNREMQTASVERMIAEAEKEVVEIETDEYGIRFTADSFSPFVLLWDSPEEPSSATPDTNPSVKTGDSSPVVLWGLFALVSFAVCAGAVKRKYK